MNVRLLGSSVGEQRRYQYLTSYVVNGTIAIDAGSLGLFGSPEEQARIEHVLISHSHIDHIATLPIFLENVYKASPGCVTAHASSEVLDSLQRDVFNGRVWPDLIALSAKETPFFELHTLTAGVPVELAGLRITPVEMDHNVPTLGFILEDDTSAVVIASDTGPTEQIWQRANRIPKLQAVFLEATFPDSLSWLANVAGHLTTSMFAREVRKLRQPARIIVVHSKAPYHDQIVREIEAQNLKDVEIGAPGKEYHFG